MLGDLLGSPTRRRLLKSLVGVGSLPVLGSLANDHLREGSALDSEVDVSPENVVSGEATKTTKRVAKPTKFDSSTANHQRHWLYDGAFPGPEIRVREGTALAVMVKNKLDRKTTVHWHGLPVPNAMDGVPGVTQDPIAPGGMMTYEFETAPAGTYLYHSHVGLQMDRGLVGPLVVESPTPDVEYDRDYTVFLDDYLARDPPSYADNPHVPQYDAFTVNGGFSDDPVTFDVAEGDRVRFRLVNGGSATTFRVGLGGHGFDVTHADGWRVKSVTADAVEIGPGERFDVVVTMDDPDRWALEARPVNANSVGSPGPARAIVEYRSSSGGDPTDPEFTGDPVTWRDLQSVGPFDGVSGTPGRTYDLTLERGREPRAWTIDGQQYPDADPLPVQPGEHVRIRLSNRSDVAHPMHLHGHFFRVGDAIKDTVLVGPRERVELDFLATNPGKWLFGCHNEYHRESGMARVVTYER